MLSNRGLFYVEAGLAAWIIFSVLSSITLAIQNAPLISYVAAVCCSVVLGCVVGIGLLAVKLLGELC